MIMKYRTNPNLSPCYDVGVVFIIEQRLLQYSLQPFLVYSSSRKG
jgi:hypothetical protein